jgi:hypothetical protein
MNNIKKAEFELTFFDDVHFKRKLGALSKIEAAFDDNRNKLPPEYYWFSDEVPLGSKVNITFELIP